MPHFEAIGHQLAEALKRYSADYIEAHLEQSQASHITYRGRELESVGKTATTGGAARAYLSIRKPSPSNTVPSVEILVP